MINEISKEDLFRKIDTLKIKCFDKEDALKSAENRIQELNKCNDYANQEIERLNNIIDEAKGYANERINFYAHKNIDFNDWSEMFDILLEQELKDSDKE